MISLAGSIHSTCLRNVNDTFGTNPPEETLQSYLSLWPASEVPDTPIIDSWPRSRWIFDGVPANHRPTLASPPFKKFTSHDHLTHGSKPRSQCALYGVLLCLSVDKRHAQYSTTSLAGPTPVGAARHGLKCQSGGRAQRSPPMRQS